MSTAQGWDKHFRAGILGKLLQTADSVCVRLHRANYTRNIAENKNDKTEMVLARAHRQKAEKDNNGGKIEGRKK